jgi:hypothetical protein
LLAVGGPLLLAGASRSGAPSTGGNDVSRIQPQPRPDDGQQGNPRKDCRPFEHPGGSPEADSHKRSRHFGTGALIIAKERIEDEHTQTKMIGGNLPADVKRTSALRRVPALEEVRFQPERGNEGDVCAFELPDAASPITVESPTGRMMAIAPGDVFLATPGYRAARRWVAGGIPSGGLVPGDDYWVLSDSGVIGDLISCSSLEMGHLGRVRYLGAVSGEDGGTLNIRQFAVAGSGNTDCHAPLYLVLGTSSEVGKTTAGVAIVRALRMQGHTTVIALKATGTPAIAEIAQYQDFGAAQAFDCLDFGLPTTYPVGREGIGDFFGKALDFCLCLPSEAVVVECAGDPVSANAPELLSCLKARRSDLKIILAAADALGAMGAKQALAELGLAISLITGPCTDTPILREWTQTLCGIPAINLLHSPNRETQSDLSGRER